MKSKIISSSLLVAGFLIGASALSTLAAWTAPGTGYPVGTNCTPPNCNTPAPLNVGANVSSLLQSKLGGLSLNTDGFGAVGLKVMNGIQLIDFNPNDPTQNPDGKVLTSDENGVGSWQLPAAGTGGGVGGVIVCSGSGLAGSQVVLSVNFTAGNCSGGVLPSAEYYGALTSFLTDDGRDNVTQITIRNKTANSVPGFDYRVNTVGTSADVTLVATYVKPGSGGSASAPAGLVVGRYEINRAMQSPYGASIVNYTGVATSAGCGSYSTIYTGNLRETSNASMGSFSHEVYLCLTQ